MTDMRVRRHPPIRQQVATILRQAIVDMRLKPGELVVERQLCEMTSASRASVREALRQLEAEGLVESKNGSGTYISVVNRQTALSIYTVREALEGVAGRLFAIEASDTDQAALREAVERFGATARASGDTARMLIFKEQFYEVLFRGSGNDVLRQMIEGLHRRVTQLRAMSLSHPGRALESAAELEAILAAVERHDGVAAEQACAEHVRRAAATIVD